MKAINKPTRVVCSYCGGVYIGKFVDGKHYPRKHTDNGRRHGNECYGNVQEAKVLNN